MPRSPALGRRSGGQTLVTTINAPPAAVTPEGRVIGLLLRLFGLGLSGYITALIAARWLGTGPSDPGISPREWAALRADVARLRELVDARTRAEALGEDDCRPTTD
jgi:hypothetical protein